MKTHTQSRFSRLLGAPLLLAASSCAETPAQVQTPVVYYVEVKSPPTPTPAPAPTPTAAAQPQLQPVSYVPAASGLNVDEDITAACKLKLDDISQAPKFAFDKSDLAEQDKEVLSQIAACVITGPLSGRSLDLVGHADPRGGREYNMALGTRRAASVRMYLVALGVPPDGLNMSSRGSLDATGQDEESWKDDRRVDIRLTLP